MTKNVAIRLAKTHSNIRSILKKPDELCAITHKYNLRVLTTLKNLSNITPH